MSGPGKFEGEPEWVESLWNLSLEGGADEELEVDGVFYLIFTIAPEDRVEIPGLPADLAEVALYEREDGFVCRADAALVRKAALDDNDALEELGGNAVFVSAGTRVEIVCPSSDGRFSDLGKGVMMEDGRVGPGAGLDVYDVRLDDGREVSALGVQINRLRGA